MKFKRRTLSLVLVLASGLILAGGLADAARAAPRTVLGELFSSAG